MSIADLNYSVKSYPSMQAALDAREVGDSLWLLDTGNSGADDVLVGAEREEVLRDVLFHFELEAIPTSWSIRKIDGSTRIRLRVEWLPVKGGLPRTEDFIWPDTEDAQVTLLRAHAGIRLETAQSRLLVLHPLIRGQVTATEWLGTGIRDTQLRTKTNPKGDQRVRYLRLEGRPS